MPGVLDRYLARRFAGWLGIILAGMLVVIFLVDFVELTRRFSDRADFSTPTALAMALMRAPALLETTLPFVFLFAAMVCLLSLSRRLELVVARAAGVSVWGFLRPPLAIALAAGALSSFAVNPLAVRLKDRADAMEAQFSGAVAPRGGTGLWFRQNGVDGPSIVHARRAGEDAASLIGVTAFVFDKQGAFREKAVAPSAEFGRGRWLLRDATVISSASPPETVESYVLATSLTRAELRQTLTAPEALSVWSLPSFIATAERTGLNSDRFRLAFHALLGRPLFLAAMIAIAATVSLLLSRYGGIGRLLVSGVGAGFLLYVLTEVINDLGGNGIINPALAAWSPAVIALTLGATVLLHQEDG